MTSLAFTPNLYCEYESRPEFTAAVLEMAPDLVPELAARHMDHIVDVFARQPSHLAALVTALRSDEPDFLIVARMRGTLGAAIDYWAEDAAIAEARRRVAMRMEDALEAAL